MVKKLWTRFKHWIIRKLGGYTEQFIHKKEAVYVPAYAQPITIMANVKADARLWYAYEDKDPEGRYRQRVMNGIRDDLMDELWEHADEGLVDFKYCDNIGEDTVTIQATVRLYKFN